jgi:cell division protein FtsB
MMIRIFNSRVLLNVCISLMLLGLFYYLLFHTMSGQRGIMALFELSSKLNHMQNELEVTRDQRLDLEHKVQSMRSDSLDLDLLEEQARKILGLSNPQEIIYLFNHNMDKTPKQ